MNKFREGDRIRLMSWTSEHVDVTIGRIYTVVDDGIFGIGFVDDAGDWRRLNLGTFELDETEAKGVDPALAFLKSKLRTLAISNNVISPEGRVYEEMLRVVFGLRLEREPQFVPVGP